jgi:O-antigen/teichoic acid export membrane protein
VLRSFITVGLLQLATMLVLLVRTKSLALLLGPENVGVMGATDRLFAVVTQTVSLSLPYAAIRFLPGAWSEGQGRFRSLAKRMVVVLAAIAAVTTAASIAITLGAPELWGRQFLPYRGVVLSAAATIPVLMLVPFITNAIAGRMHEGRSMTFTLVHAAVFSASAVFGAKWAGLSGVYMVYAVLGPLVVLWGLSVTFKGTSSAAAPAPQDPASIGWLGLPTMFWRFSGTLMLLTFVMPYAALQVYTTVFRKLGPTTAGWMVAAIGLSLSVRTLLGSAHPVFLTPNVNRGGTPAERLVWANAFQRTFLLLTLGLVPPLLLFSGLAVNILYSAEFAPGARFAVFFILAEVVNLIAGTYGALVIAFDHFAFNLVQNVTAQLILAGVALALIPRLGIAGAGLGTLAAPVFLLVTGTLFLWRRHGLRVPASIGVLAATVVVCLAVAGAVGSVWQELTITSVAAKLALYAAILAVGAWFLKPNEWARLRSLALRRRPTAGAAA